MAATFDDCTQKNPLDVVILAAGKGTRLKSQLPKVLHPLLGMPLLGHVCRAAQTLKPQRLVVVIGHGKNQVEEYLSSLTLEVPIKTVLQEPQCGTGHALQQVAQQIETLSQTVVLLSGDVPLIRPETLKKLVSQHQETHSAITVLGAKLENPTGYGRLIATHTNLDRIVEEKDATEAERTVTTVNSGMYAYHWPTVAPLLDKLSNTNAQSEWYATDLIGLTRADNQRVSLALLDDAAEMQGVNTRMDLAVCHTTLQHRLNQHWMTEGVTIVDPSSTWIGPEVTLAPDVLIEPGTRLLGSTEVGAGCTLGPWTTLENVTIGEQSTVIHSVVRDSQIGSYTQIGPFAHVRNGCQIEDYVRLGNFVEAKNTAIGCNTNAAHLSYLGDATLGHHVNMGAGSIIANYDPIRQLKQPTTVANNAKIGCNTVLVAPVTVGDNSCVAAGTVVTENVDAGDLTIGRCRQTHVPGWVERTLSKKTPPQQEHSATESITKSVS